MRNQFAEAQRLGSVPKRRAAGSHKDDCHHHFNHMSKSIKKHGNFQMSDVNCEKGLERRLRRQCVS